MAATTARLAGLAAMLVLAACDHTDPIATANSQLGARTTGVDVQLTYNGDQDYWPNWTADGRGILYAFVTSDAPVGHRCVGMLPPKGGTRFWQMCDNRTTQADSVSSFTGFALDDRGRLLYAEATSIARFADIPDAYSIWLADTARPFVRKQLVTLPIQVGAQPYNWVSELQWTGPATFTALAQVYLPGQGDSTFSNNGAVLIGTISGDHATMQMIVGTDSATDYAIIDAGTAIAFTRRDDRRLLRVPIAGGVPSVIAQVLPDASDLTVGQLVGLSCNTTACIVATAPIVLSYRGDLVLPEVSPHFTGGAPEGDLRVVSLSTGEVHIVDTDHAILATPMIAPGSHDVVVQRGGVWGHLQTVRDGSSNLHLLSGLLP
ncbi:MAG: hypothetical protein ACREL5_01270 [Gemmatimonadales bacterium]